MRFIRLRRVHANRFFACCAVAFLAGCRTPIAQLRSFADATVNLQSAIRAGGERTIAATAAAPYRDAQRRLIPVGDPNHPSNQLRALWQERTHAADGLVAYADALEGIAAAGEDDDANTAMLADAVTRLAAFIPGAAGMPVAQGVSLAASVGAAANQVRTAKHLSEAVERARPAVEAIAGILRSDLADLGVQFRSASLAIERSADAEFGPRNQYRIDLLARRETLRGQVVSTLSSGNLDATAAALAKIDALIAKTDADDAAYRSRIGALLAERAIVAELIAAASEGAATWVGAHRDLQAAIAEGRQPDVRLILARVQEIRALVETLRARERTTIAGK